MRMTREKAIKELNEIIDEGWLISDMDKCTAIDACEMAIKALEQEPTTKNDCEHCSKTYGTLGCCDYVNNEPVYSCKEGHEEYARGMRKFGSTTKNDLSSELEKNSKKLENLTAKNDLGVDCIDRAELLKAMDTWDKFGYTETGCFVRAPKNDYVPYVHYEDMVNCVKGMPSVTPQEPKTGHWEWVQYDYNPKLGNWHCSECRNIVVECVNKNDEGGIPIYKYCPNCGVKMVEPQESGDKE